MKNLLWILFGAGSVGAIWYVTQVKKLKEDPLFAQAAIKARAKSGIIIPDRQAAAQHAVIPATPQETITYEVESLVSEAVNEQLPPSENWLSEKIRKGAIKSESKGIIDQLIAEGKIIPG